MGLAPDQAIGPYRIVSKLGEGGMGEVWRAHDARLNRDVAIKALPPSLATDPERIARFDREAQILAALKHPAIAGIHGLEQAGTTRYLVLEFVDGASLAATLARGAMPIDEALGVARQIAEALEAAHDRGIVHRDLKPANIMLTPEGAVKVLDFGLAKALAPDGGSATVDVANSPTLTAPTQVGMILGTAAYMAPEQAKGRAADKRSDVWAFGCVLYELLTGARAFAGDDVSDTLAAVLRADPDWTRLPAATPAPIVRLLRRCLVKDRRQRLPDISAARFEIDDWIAGHRDPVPVTAAATPPRRGRTALVALAAGIAGAGAAGAVFYSALRPTPAASRVARFPVESPASVSPRSRITGPGIDIVVAPDGSKLVYRGITTGAGDVLVVREMDGTQSAVLPGVSGNTNAFSISRDGRTLAFHVPGTLQTLTFGSPVPRKTLDLASAPDGTDWLSNDVIVYASEGKLFQVNASGGSPHLIAEPPANDTSKTQYLFPEVVPGGQALLYTAAEGTARRIEARPFKGGNVTVVVENASFPKVTAAGHLLFVREGRLMSARFDASSLRTAGPAIAIDEDVGSAKNRGGSNFDVADDGTLVMISAADLRFTGRFVWKSRNGAAAGYVGSAAMEGPRYPRLSHDGKRLAATVGSANIGQIWVFGLVGAAQPLKLTFDGHNTFPMWTPDDRHLVFWTNSVNGEGRILHTLPSDGSELTPRVLGKMPPNTVGDLASDGISLLFTTSARETESDLWLFRIGSGQPAISWLAERFSEMNPAFSHDRKWVAYMSRQSGPLEVWVRPFPGPGPPVRITAEGGREPRWSHDDRELYYQLDGKLMAVPMTVTPTTIQPGPPRVIVDGGFFRWEPNTPGTYDVARDGRVLMIEQPDSTTGQYRGVVSVVIGFDELLRRQLK